MYGEADADSGVDFGDFFHRQGVGDEVHAGAAVFFRIRDAHQAEFAHFVVNVAREDLFFIALGRAGGDPFLGEFLHCFAQAFLVFGQYKIHLQSSPISSAFRRSRRFIAYVLFFTFQGIVAPLFIPDACARSLRPAGAGAVLRAAWSEKVRLTSSQGLRVL